MAASDSNNFDVPLSLKHEGFLAHRKFRYLKLAILICILAIIGYIFGDVGLRHNGGTWLGYTLGTISALLIVWLLLLGMRKRAITQGHWNLKGWTSAHVYLGASLLIIATLHTGFQFGVNVHTLAYVLMVIVILSGFFGVYYYATLPRRMSDNRSHRSEDDMLEEIRGLDRELLEQAKSLDRTYIEIVEASISKTKIRPGPFTSIAAAQRNCSTTRAIRKLGKLMNDAPDHMRAPLEDMQSILRRKSASLRRTRQHIRYKALMRLWLHFHVPLSFALFAALIAHIVSVFFYW